MSIRILPEEVASQIAAGEVIERPASVVKELLENALDAHAQQIVIRVEAAGQRLIEVSDDGAGIAENELQLAVARHATSKLRSADDLYRVTTLGFRGEALASIASVSRLTITSRTREATAAARLLAEGGRSGTVERVGAPFGTQVRVEDLFFNVPARLKFLKREITERQQIDTLVTRYAIAYPHVRFQLFHDGRSALQTSGNGNQREILANLYGVEITRQMLEVAFTEDEVQLSGYISPINITRSNRREITFFVNGRWVQDAPLVSALLQAYQTMLMVARYPLAVLFLHLPPEEVDVNVHPAKAEVRFRKPERYFAHVQRAARRALLAYSPIPQINPPGWHSQSPTLPLGSPKQIDPAWEMAAQTDEAAPLESLPAIETPPLQTELPSGQLPLLRLVGQVGNTYLVAEGPDGLYLVDQHAAHERVLFERFKKRSPAAIHSQTLLESAVLHLPAHSAALLEEQMETLKRLGFLVEPFGPDTFRLTAIPDFLSGADPLAALRAVVEDIEEDETPLQGLLEDRLIARICKRVAIKGGQALSTEEQTALLRELEACQSPRTCPHGRPTMIHLSVSLLERQFGRRGSR
ncbi:MAG: DNA mismatch repair endonuclease MutL [Anaerolineae bacterium]|nr:DNA mismatch repair endonuclease MutL [Anaerolineae bacterium]